MHGRIPGLESRASAGNCARGLRGASRGSVRFLLALLLRDDPTATTVGAGVPARAPLRSGAHVSWRDERAGGLDASGSAATLGAAASRVARDSRRGCPAARLAACKRGSGREEGGGASASGATELKCAVAGEARADGARARGPRAAPYSTSTCPFMPSAACGSHWK